MLDWLGQLTRCIHGKRMKVNDGQRNELGLHTNISDAYDGRTKSDDGNTRMKRNISAFIIKYRYRFIINIKPCNF
jgi:hypothetical protein